MASESQFSTLPQIYDFPQICAVRRLGAMAIFFADTVKQEEVSCYHPLRHAYHQIRYEYCPGVWAVFRHQVKCGHPHPLNLCH